MCQEIKKRHEHPRRPDKIHTILKRQLSGRSSSYDDWTVAQYGHAKKKACPLEGKEYVINDGDVVLFRFNV